MAEIAAAYVSLLPSARGFGRATESQVGGELDSSGRRMGTRLGSALKIGAGAALAGGAILAGFLKGAISEAQEAEVVTARTENVIKSMGLSSKVSASQIGDLATSLSNKTAIDDEAIQSGANLLLTFGEVAKSAGVAGGVFERTTALAVDMSAAMGTDMKSASLQLGKALNDPIKGVTALTRSGVSFTQQQRDQIAAFVEAGEVAKAQGVILGEVQKQFGGAAEAMATPAERARVAFGNLQEQIGTLLLPLLARLADFASGTLIPAISNFVTQVQTGVGVGGQFAAAFSLVASNMGTIAPVLATVVGGLVAYRVASLAAAAAAAIQAAGTATATGATWSLNAALRANPIGLVITALTALVAGLVIAYKRSETFRNMVNALWAALKVAGTWVVDIARKALAFAADLNGRAMPAVRAITSAIGSALVAAVRTAIGVVTSIIGAIGRFGRALIDAVQFAARFATGVVQKGQEVLNWFQALPGRVTGALAGLAATMYAKGREIVGSLLDGIRSMAGSIAAAIDSIVPDSIPLPDIPFIGKASTSAAPTTLTPAPVTAPTAITSDAAAIVSELQALKAVTGAQAAAFGKEIGGAVRQGQRSAA